MKQSNLLLQTFEIGVCDGWNDSDCVCNSSDLFSFFQVFQQKEEVTPRNKILLPF